MTHVSDIYAREMFHNGQSICGWLRQVNRALIARGFDVSVEAIESDVLPYAVALNAYRNGLSPEDLAEDIAS